MKELDSIIRLFPMQELAIRRFFASDSDFREICEAQLTATCALERWKSDISRAEEYREMIGELKQEIEDYLEKQQRPTGGSTTG